MSYKLELFTKFIFYFINSTSKNFAYKIRTNHIKRNRYTANNFQLGNMVRTAEQKSWWLCPLIDSKFHKKATSIGFDIVMSKKMFLMNIKTIKAQISNNVKSIQ